MSKKEKKSYNFGEKTEEYHSKQNKKLPVWQSPKYLQSKAKAIELIELGKYGLDEGDFWILMNATKSGGMMYTGLIVSHNGCLKINDGLDIKMKFKPSSVELIKDEGEKIKVMKYVNDEQGVYEFGEISPKNCMNDYPYAMVLKRLMDRVILKNSKVGFFGIYSDSESDDFKENLEPKKVLTDQQKLANISDKDMQETLRIENQKQFRRIKDALEDCKSVEEINKVAENEKKQLNKLAKYAKELFINLKDCKEGMKNILEAQATEDANYIQAG